MFGYSAVGVIMEVTREKEPWKDMFLSAEKIVGPLENLHENPCSTWAFEAVTVWNVHHHKNSREGTLFQTLEFGTPSMLDSTTRL